MKAVTWYFDAALKIEWEIFFNAIKINLSIHLPVNQKVDVMKLVTALIVMEQMTRYLDVLFFLLDFPTLEVNQDNSSLLSLTQGIYNRMIVYPCWLNNGFGFKFPEGTKRHLKKTGGYISWNLMTITTNTNNLYHLRNLVIFSFIIYFFYMFWIVLNFW